MALHYKAMGSMWNLGMLFSWITAAFSQCDYYQDANPGQTYYIYSPNYPNKYMGRNDCRWYAVSPPGTTIDLNCPVVDLPQTESCIGDRLSISVTGDLAMNDAEHYCGRGSFERSSVGNKLNVLLQTTASSPGGKFLCSITASVPPPDPPTPPPQACECGWKKKTKIVGGSETDVNEYPMMAGLIDGMLKILYCGATIISPRFVLTAAHCLARRLPENVAVLIGDHDLSTGTDTASARLIRAAQLVPHPQYEGESQHNDIGVVRVSSDMVYTPQVGPACLPFRFRGQTFEGDIVTALGWGTVEFGGPTSDVLKQTKLGILPDEQCRAAYNPGAIDDNQLCSYEVDTDACQSDSGGPLLWQDPATGRLHLIGVISYGIACATTKPGVNTRVASYLDWITEVTEGNYCYK